MTNLIKRSLTTALKLPFSIAWDCISLGNMGEGSSTSRVLAEHQAQKSLDNVKEITNQLKTIAKTLRDSQI
jgi:hypothetical protein